MTLYLRATYTGSESLLALSEPSISEAGPPVVVFTEPSEGILALNNVTIGVSNDGFDNVENNLIIRARDHIISPEGKDYEIMSYLGKGTFGQVTKCVDVATGEEVAIKVIKNKRNYYFQGLVEVKIMLKLNTEDKEDQEHIEKMFDYFTYRSHLCIVYELLGSSLFDKLRDSQYTGFSYISTRFFLHQILESMGFYKEQGIIHCDLKPENILFKVSPATDIKLIDFGSACFEGHEIYQYIQSRFYRAPEILLGISYLFNIDMWSLGCIAFELMAGLPLFPGNSEYDQLRMIIKILGYAWFETKKCRTPPEGMIKRANEKKIKMWFKRDESGRYQLKTLDDLAREGLKDKVKVRKMCYDIQSLDEIALVIPQLHEVEESPEGKKKANLKGECFVHFLKGIMRWEPELRYTPGMALQHPFITGLEWDPSFTPIPNSVKDTGGKKQQYRFCQESCPSKFDSSPSSAETSQNKNSCFRPNVANAPEDYFYGFVYGKLSSVVRENDLSVINQVSRFMKQQPAPQNPPTYQSYPYAPPQPAPTMAPSYQAWAPAPAPVPDPAGYAHAEPQPQPYAAPPFDYYSRSHAWKGYAYSLDQYSSYARNPPTEPTEELQPHVISRGFVPKRKKPRPPGPPNQPPVNAVPPPQPMQYVQQPCVPYPPFFAGARWPLHRSGYPYQYPSYAAQDYTSQWYGYQPAMFTQPSQVPAPPVIPPPLNTEQTQSQPLIKPSMKESTMTEKKSWNPEHALNRVRSNSDAMEEGKKKEEGRKHMSSNECSAEAIGCAGHSLTFDSRDPKIEEEPEEEKLANKLSYCTITKPMKPHKGYKGRGGRVKRSSDVKWAKKKPNPALSISVSEVSAPKNADNERYLNKIIAAQDMQKRGVATEKEMLLTGGQRSYYNKGTITTPRRVMQTAQGENVGSVEKSGFSKLKDDSHNAS